MAKALSVTSPGWVIFGILCQLIFVGSAFVLDNYWVALVPLSIVMITYLGILPLRHLYVILFGLIPFSIEMEMGSIGLDFPAELLLLFITLVSIFLLIRDFRSFRLSSWGFLLITLLCWGWICTLFAQYPLLSAKFMLAKLWYVIPFFFGAHYAINHLSDWHRLLRVFVFSTVAVCIYTFINHGFDGWSFDTRMYAGAPFMRNHVNYACLILMSLPACRYLYQRSKSSLYLYTAVLLIFFSYFAYARIIYLSLFIAIAGLITLRHRLLPVLLSIGILASVLGIGYFMSGDRLIELAPDYSRTISHDHFDDMLAATYMGQDISMMERLYRWVAGIEMSVERPFFGHGPSNFYSCYQDYSVNSFQTYVSDNPEHSGIHSYYLMMLVEQGIIGLLLFISLLLVSLVHAHRLYTNAERQHRYIIELSVSWMLLIATIIILNDMLEVITVGPFFFLAAFLLYRLNFSRAKSV